jgi:hypothetical protein
MNAPEETTVWYPTADDLLLPEVPQSEQPRIRERLRPWLSPLRGAISGQPIGVERGRCWQVAQALAMTAQDAGVLYVEGAYVDPRPFKRFGSEPDAHAWVMVDGFCVDLIWELLFVSQRWYQPLHSYTHQQVGEFIRDSKPGCSTSITAWPFNNEKCLSQVGGDPIRLIEVIFQPAKEELRNRRDEYCKRINQHKARSK